MQTTLMDQLKRHGLPVILLAVAVWYMEGRSREMERRVEECHQQHILIYKDYNEEMTKVIERNTRAIERIEAAALQAHRR